MAYFLQELADSTPRAGKDAGLYYYGYRYYDTETGRWLNRDPIEERGGVNLYGFVGNDGVGGIDLLGMQEPVPIGPGGAFGGGGYGNRYTPIHPTKGPLRETKYNASGPSVLDKVKTILPGEVGSIEPFNFTLLWIPYPGGNWDVTLSVSGGIENCCHVDTDRMGTQFRGSITAATSVSLGYGAGGNRGLKRDKRINNNTKLRNRKTGRFASNPEKGLGLPSSSIEMASGAPNCRTGLDGSIGIEIGGKAGALATLNPYLYAEFAATDPVRVGYGVRAGAELYVGAELYFEVNANFEGTIIIE